MATCPHCGVSSRTVSDAIVIEKVLIARPLGTWSLSGSQLKTSATQRYRMACQCGWQIDGYVDGEDFYGYPDTQRFPDE